MYEYDMRMLAYRLREVDRDYVLHYLAWINRDIKAMKSQGKKKRVPVFKKFKQFFDYEKQVSKVFGTNEKENRTITGMRRLQSSKRGEDNAGV